MDIPVTMRKSSMNTRPTSARPPISDTAIEAESLPLCVFFIERIKEIN